MKRIIILLILMSLFVCGCGKSPQQDDKKESQPSNAETLEQDTELEEETEDSNNIMAQYKAQYNASYAINDALVKDKMLLVNDSRIIFVFHIPSAPQVTFMQKDAVQRVEKSDFGDKCNVQIYDKSNMCISICILKEQEEELLSQINDK